MGDRDSKYKNPDRNIKTEREDNPPWTCKYFGRHKWEYKVTNVPMKVPHTMHTFRRRSAMLTTRVTIRMCTKYGCNKTQMSKGFTGGWKDIKNNLLKKEHIDTEKYPGPFPNRPYFNPPPPPSPPSSQLSPPPPFPPYEKLNLDDADIGGLVKKILKNKRYY